MKAIPFFTLLVLLNAPLKAQSADSLWLDSINQRASAAVDAGDLRLCLAIFSEALDTARARYGAENEISIYLLESLGDVQKAAGDYPGAERSLSALLEICKKSYGARHVRIARAMGQLGFTRHNLGQPETVEKLLTESRQMFEDLGMHFSHELASVCSNLAAYYQSRGQFLKAEQLHLEAVAVEKNMPVFDEAIYSAAINNLAVFYSVNQRADEALPYLDISLRIKEKQLGKRHPFYLITLENKGLALLDAGRYGEAEIILKEALDAAQAVFTPGDIKRATYLRGVGALYEKTGKYEEAIRLNEESLALVRQQYGIQHPAYISDLLRLAGLHRACNRLDAGDTLLRQAILTLEQAHRTESDKYALALTQLGEICQQKRQLDAARPLIEQGARIGEKIIGISHPSYHGFYGEALVRQHLLENRPDSALRLLDAMRDAIVGAYGERHERFIKMETQYGQAWQLKGDAAHALQYFQAAFGALQNNLAENFRFLSAGEREKFARTFEYYRLTFLAAVRAFPGDAPLRAFLYDLTLFQKELLSSYDRQLISGWQQGADSSFHRYVELRRMIARQWTLPVQERIDLPELEAQRYALEKTLTGQAALAATPAVFNTPQWQQVQQALQADDAALEWLGLPPAREGQGGLSCYAVLILRQGMPAPELLLLDGTDRTDALFASKGARGLQYASRTYAGDALYRTLWQPLENRLEGVKRIFYAPGGMLHLLNFEAMQLPGGQLLSEKYQMVRLTNTARILDSGFGRPLAPAGSALLAGGLDYESAAAANAAETPNLPTGGGALWRGGGMVREWSPLPNTLPEVKRLADLLRQKKVQTELQTGPNGSETAVKARCAAAPPEILHFATHGFFFEKNTAGSGSLGLVTAENPMFRSGLILAGANPAWRGQPAAGLPDDGILTADEISLLPLRATALVVLSACETGLGDVRDDEGVYGLQRAFRLAGAQNIVMSLWRVPDEQTRQFMVTFYAALLERGDIRSAFQNARLALRKQYGNPFYWAGFVLLE